MFLMVLNLRENFREMIGNSAVELLLPIWIDRESMLRLSDRMLVRLHLEVSNVAAQRSDVGSRLLLLNFVHVDRMWLEEDWIVDSLGNVVLELWHRRRNLDVSSEVVLDKIVLVLSESFVVAVERLLRLLMLLLLLLLLLLLMELLAVLRQIRRNLLHESASEDILVEILLLLVCDLLIVLGCDLVVLMQWLHVMLRSVFGVGSEVRRRSLARELLLGWERSLVELLSWSIDWRQLLRGLLVEAWR